MWGGGIGIKMEVNNSPFSQIVSLGAWKKPERGVSREDSEHWSSTTDSAAIKVGGRSAEGTALEIFPPKVATERIWGEAIVLAASARAGMN